MPPWSLRDNKWDCYAVIKALHPHGLILLSPPNIWDVIDNIYMLWMGIGIRHHAGTNTFVGTDLVSWQNACVLVGQQMRLFCSLFEALNPHLLIPPSSSNIWEVIDNLHMLWMVIWIRHHAGINTFVRPDLVSRQNALVFVTSLRNNK